MLAEAPSESSSSNVSSLSNDLSPESVFGNHHKSDEDILNEADQWRLISRATDFGAVINEINVLFERIANSRENNVNEFKNQKTAIPAFATLLKNYPKPYWLRPDRTKTDKDKPLDDKTGENFEYFNQCAIRLSISLRKSGVNLKGAKNVSNPKPKAETYANGNIIGALNLATFLKTKVFNSADFKSYDGSKDDITTLLAGKTGIIFFQNFEEEDSDGTRFTSWSNAHIDLWNKGTIQGNFAIPTEATRIWFFEIK